MAAWFPAGVLCIPARFQPVEPETLKKLINGKTITNRYL